jgi:hypothetical protein
MAVIGTCKEEINARMRDASMNLYFRASECAINIISVSSMWQAVGFFNTVTP